MSRNDQRSISSKMAKIGNITLRARFTKLERNSIKVPMGEENSAGDLLTMRTLKNTDAARSIYQEQCKLPPALRHALFGR